MPMTARQFVASKRREEEKAREEQERKKLEKRKEYAQQRRRENDQFTFMVSKNHHMRELLEYRLRKEKGVTMTQYVIQAVLEKLQRDGINIHKFDGK